MPHWSTVAIAIILILMLSVIASAEASARYKLCNVEKTRCVTVTMPSKGKCRDIFGYWVCNGKPRR